jgi:hypothetical protein
MAHKYYPAKLPNLNIRNLPMGFQEYEPSGKNGIKMMGLPPVHVRRI